MLQIFDSLTKLVALDLSHNSLTKLHGELLNRQQSLQILNLQHNQLSKIEQGALSSLLNLHILLLSHNQLTSLPASSLVSLASHLLPLPRPQQAALPAS